MSRPLCLTFLGLLAASAASAGPWTREPGRLYARLAVSHLRTTTLATPDGQLREIPGFRLQQIPFYLELGLFRLGASHGLAAILGLPVARRTEIENFDDASGVGDVQAGLQLGLGNAGPWVFAARALAQAPTGDETKGQGVLPTGSGIWEGRFFLSAGRSFSGGYGFLEVGHELRTKGLRDGFLYEAQLGFHPVPGLTVAGFARGVEPWRSEPGDAFLGSASGLGDGVRYLRAGGWASVSLGGGVALELSADRALRARNLARGTTIEVGVSLVR